MPFLFVPVTIILTVVQLQHISLLPFSIFCLLFSYLSYDLPNPLPFHLLSSILHLYFNFSLLTSIFYLPSYVPLFCFFPSSVHYSLPSLSDLDNLTFHPLWLCESSFTFSILHCSLYYSEPCSIKFLPILVLAPQLVIVIYPCKNTTRLCLLCLSKLRTPWFLGEGATHKLKPSPLVSLCYPHTHYYPPLLPVSHCSFGSTVSISNPSTNRL